MPIPFVPTYDTLQAGSPWLNLYYNTLIDDVVAALQNNDGSVIVTPVPLTKSGQDVNGGRNAIYDFQRLFGTNGGAGHRVAVRDATAFMPNPYLDEYGIQYAIDDLPDAGGIVLCPPGVYAMTGLVRMSGSGSTKTNVLLLGFGAATTFTYTSVFQTQTYLVTMGHGSTPCHHAVVGIRFDGNSGFQGYFTNSLLNVATINASTASCLIQSCDFVNLNGSPIYITSGGNSIIRGCRFSNFTQDAVIVYSSGALNDVAISGCTISGGLQNHGIQLATGANVTHQRTSISNSIIYKSNSSSVYIANGGVNSIIKDISINGNIMDGGGGNSAFPVHLSAVHAYNAYGNCDIKDVSVANNLIVDREEGDGVNFVLTFPRVPVGNGTSGISDFVVVGNTMVGFDAGYGVNSGQHEYSFWTGPIRHPLVASNVIGNCYNYGVLYEGTDYYFGYYHTTRGQVFGNVFFDDRKDEAFMNYGIALRYANSNANNGPADYCVVTGNAVYGTTSGGVLDQGAFNDVSHNTHGLE